MGNGLLDGEYILRTLTRDAPWHEGHGADGDFLGMGLLYYGFVYATRARCAVCLGSGGGFVPRLMRQAQRDLGIAAESRTILVDADRPQAGWGAPAWTKPTSFFRQAFADVDVVLATTTEAANTVFEAQGMTIDVLHIDADHAFDACLVDFHTYRKFLRTGSIVTLHDTNYDGAGVRHVIEHIRTRNDCEVVDFPDIGSGTAVVRIVRDAAEGPAPVARSFGGESAAVTLARRDNAPAVAPAAMGWKYLEAEAFATRNILAAHYVRDCPTVIELGGGETAFDAFATARHDAIFIVDPFIRESRKSTLNGDPCDVWRVRARFQDIEWTIRRPFEYGLIALGLELQGLGADDYAALYRLVDGARVTVIEFPTSWGPSNEQYQLIRRHTRTRERMTCKLDLDGNDLGNLENSWPPRCDREIHVLVPA